MQCQEYTIKQGDTLYSLARSHGVTVEEIMGLNEGIEPTTLIPGTIICIPRGGAIIQDPDLQAPEGLIPQPVMPGFRTTYVVKEGDTLSSIANSNGISIEQLLFANPTVNPGYIQAGTRLNIPEADVAIPGSIAYTVKAGETIQSILSKLAIGYGRLKLFNPNIDLTSLKEGTLIFIPEVFGGSAGKCAIGSYSYTIEKGDTIDSIASKFNITPQQLLNTNAFKDLGEIKEGKIICLPLNNFDDVI